MDLKQIKYFLVASQEKSITKAAKKLFISQQGLSASIRKLEEELQSNLFERTSKGIELTEQGVFFLSKAEQMMQIMNECDAYFTDNQPEVTILNIGCAYGVLGFLHTYFSAFVEKHPFLNLNILEFPDLLCDQAVLDETVDVGFSVGLLKHSEIASHFLFQKNVCGIVHYKHPLAEFDEIRISQLAKYPILLMNNQFKIHHNYLFRCKEAGFVPEIVIHAGEVVMIHKLASKNKGVGLTIDFMFEDFPRKDLKKLIMKDSTFVWDVYLLLNRKTPHPNYVFDLVNYMIHQDYSHL